MNYPAIILKPGREKSVIFNHPWLFSGAIQSKNTKVQDGDIVDILDSGSRFIARGYYNSRSNIALRILTFKQTEIIDSLFFEQKIKLAFQRRKNYLNLEDTTAFRLVFAEADGLPGLIVDRYSDCLVLQIHTLGMEKLKNIIVDSLVKVFQPKAIFERSDLEVRKKEGLIIQPKGLLYGELQQELVEIKEHGVKFCVDIQNGQKTGFFLDQRENRDNLKFYVKNKTVLNLFAYSGGFSCYALNFGAKHVTSVDISDSAMKLCKENIAQNGWNETQHQAITQDVFEYLKSALQNNIQFDVVIVDPPAFAKTQSKINNAINAYIKLNEAALKVLKSGGILMTASCSGFVSQEMFRNAIFQAAFRANKTESNDLTLLEQRIQPFDHPLRLYFPEGEYLKFLILQKNSQIFE